MSAEVGSFTASSIHGERFELRALARIYQTLGFRLLRDNRDVVWPNSWRGISG